MITYNIGDSLVCEKEMTVYDSQKNEISVCKGEIYEVTDKEEYETGSVYYELYNEDRDLWLTLWNDPEHEIVDWHFRKN